MAYYLSRSSYVCIADEHAVFLNLARDSYFCVAPENIAGLQGDIYGWPGASKTATSRVTSSSLNAVAQLAAEGLVTRRKSAGKDVEFIKVDSVVSTIDSVQGLFPKLDKRDFVRFVMSWVLTTLILSIFPLKVAVRRACRRKARARAGRLFDEKEAHRLMFIYFMLQPNFFSSKNACLRNSLTFVEFFSRYGFYPKLVIGVKAVPFSAHCWVQEGSMVLNDYISRVTQFTPIFAL